MVAESAQDNVVAVEDALGLEDRIGDAFYPMGLLASNSGLWKPAEAIFRAEVTGIRGGRVGAQPLVAGETSMGHGKAL